MGAGERTPRLPDAARGRAADRGVAGLVVVFLRSVDVAGRPETDPNCRYEIVFRQTFLSFCNYGISASRYCRTQSEMTGLPASPEYASHLELAEYNPRPYCSLIWSH